MSGAIPEKNEGWLVFLDMEDERPNAWFATEEDAYAYLDSVDHPEYGDVLAATAKFELRTDTGYVYGSYSKRVEKKKREANNQTPDNTHH